LGIDSDCRDGDNAGEEIYINWKTMSIAKRISEAIDRLVARDAEGALIPISIAVDATAQMVYPMEKNNVAYKTWLHNNLWLITKVGFGNVSINNFHFRFDHPDVTPDKDGYVSIDQILYHLVRCGLLHQAKLPSNIQFNYEGEIKLGDNEIVFDSSIIYGMIAAVVVSPFNSGETIPIQYGLTVFGQTKSFNELWGRQEDLLALFEPRHIA
jgi:hypothetical protein